jgi:hypothetical protein
MLRETGVDFHRECVRVDGEVTGVEQAVNVCSKEETFIDLV